MNFTISERAVADSIMEGKAGQELVRENRVRLDEGRHYERRAGGFFWSVEGVTALRGLLGLDAPAEGPEKETVRVARVFPTNAQVMEGTLVKDGARVRVRVRDASLFVPGMVLDGCWRAGLTLWEYTGRLPVQRGRWR